MRYNIEPLRIIGANIYGKTFATSSEVSREGIQKDDLEQVLRLMPSLDGFYLTAELPISLEAKVLRKVEPGREIVRLSSGGRHIDLLRDGAGKSGDIAVSCNPDGDEVPVETLNITFRGYDDSFTDRGLIWVYPGNPATMGFFIKAQTLKTPGAVAEIITAAEEALKTKVLAHFSERE